MRGKRTGSVLGVLGVLLLVSAGSLIPGALFSWKEKKLLSGHGILEMEASVSSGREEQTREDSGREQLPGTEQIEQVLRTWRDCDAEFLHEPEREQLSMEEAFEAGRAWIHAMALEMDFPFSLFDKGQESGGEDVVSAVLSMAAGRNGSLPGEDMEVGEEFPGEPYYSYWKMRFRNQSGTLFLSVNAVTGQVWEAELILYMGNGDFSEDFDYRSLSEFLELSGVENPVGGYVEQENGAVFYLTDTLIYAQTERKSGQWVSVWTQEGAKEEGPCMRIWYRLGVI